jgi:hypothetical protein
MKRLRLLLMIPVCLLSLGAAIAEDQAGACAYSQQYIIVGGVYWPVNGYGSGYACLDFGGICTYYKPSPVFQPNYYAPCRQGLFVWIM